MMVCTPSSDTESLASSFWKLTSAMLASLAFLDSHASRNGLSSSCAQSGVHPYGHICEAGLRLSSNYYMKVDRSSCCDQHSRCLSSYNTIRWAPQACAKLYWCQDAPWTSAMSLRSPLTFR